MRALFVTGETYVNRRALRALGGVWSREDGGYFVPEAKAGVVATLPGVVAEVRECDADPFRPLTPDELRAYREERQERYRERLLSRAASAERRGEEARARIKPHERDFLRLMEPVKRGHHSQRRHEKLLERSRKSFEDAGREFNEAEKLRRRAEWLAPVAVKGDAAARREAEREAGREAIGLGDKIKHVVYGSGVVVKINPKSYRVKWDRGFVGSIDPGVLDLVEKGAGVAPPKAERKFKAGQPVWYYIHGRGGAGENSRREAVVKRATPTGYSVEWFYTSAFDRGRCSSTVVTREAHLEPREVGEAAA